MRSFECLGACDIAPMASVDGVYVGPIALDDVPTLLDQARAGGPVLPDKQLVRRPVADPRVNSREYPIPPVAEPPVGGLGNEAFSAQQVFRRGGAVTDVATVVVRYHNVVVTASMNGLQHSNRGSYGPVSMSQLSSAALAFAQAAEATLH